MIALGPGSGQHPMNHCHHPLGMGLAQYLTAALRRLVYLHNTACERIVKIVTEIGDDIGIADNRPLSCFRHVFSVIRNDFTIAL